MIISVDGEGFAHSGKKTTPVQFYIVIIFIIIFMNKFTFLNINEIFLCFVCLGFLSRYSVGGLISSYKIYFPTTEKKYGILHNYADIDGRFEKKCAKTNYLFCRCNYCKLGIQTNTSNDKSNLWMMKYVIWKVIPLLGRKVSHMNFVVKIQTSPFEWNMLERKEIQQTTSVELGFFVMYIFKMSMFLMVVEKNALKDT